jgi:hypothetical protein
MISNIQVASAGGLRSRTRGTRTVDYDPNGAPNLVSLRRAQFYLLDHTHPFPEWARITQEGSLFQNIAYDLANKGFA